MVRICVRFTVRTGYQIFDFELTVDNRLNPSRFTNSQSRTEIPAMDREVTLTVNTPYTSSETALHDAATHKTGVAATAVFTNGNRSITFTTPALQKAAESPTVMGRDQEIKLPLRFVARRSGSDLELQITNDSTG